MAGKTAAGALFRSGDRVCVLFADAGWCPGVVSARIARRDGGSVYKIRFDDGEVWNDVSPTEIAYEEDVQVTKRQKRAGSTRSSDVAKPDSEKEEATVEPACVVASRVIACDSRGHWCEAKVMEADVEGKRVKVHFKGWGSRWDEWILFGTGRLRSLPLLADYNVGDLLTAADSIGNWCQAQVLAVRNPHGVGPQELQVHFIGWAAKWDEWIDVNSGRLRPLIVGERVLARDSSANWITATVTGEKDEDSETRQLKVHFDGWASRWDEWVPVMSGRLQRLQTAFAFEKISPSHPIGSTDDAVKVESLSPTKHYSTRRASETREADPAAPAETPSFEEGTKVWGRYMAKEYGAKATEFKATITRLRADGTFDLLYDDGDREAAVEARHLRLRLEKKGVNHAALAGALGGGSSPSASSTSREPSDEDAKPKRPTRPSPKEAAGAACNGNAREPLTIETGPHSVSPGAAAGQHSAVAAQRLLLLAQSHAATASYTVGASTAFGPQSASAGDMPHGVADGLHALRRHLTCPICSRIFVGAQVLPCQHAFCEECILNVVRATTPNAHCVACRAPFFRREITPSSLLQHIVRSYHTMADSAAPGSQSS